MKMHLYQLDVKFHPIYTKLQHIIYSTLLQDILNEFYPYLSQLFIFAKTDKLHIEIDDFRDPVTCYNQTTWVKLSSFKTRARTREVIKVDNHQHQDFFLCAKDRIRASDLSLPNAGKLYMCKDGSYIIEIHKCDGIKNCRDGEDEHCDHISFSGCHFPECRCETLYHQCSTGQCVPFDKLCDGKLDCHGGEDEQLCFIIDVDMSRKLNVVYGNGTVGFCGTLDYIACQSGSQCYPRSKICQYDTISGELHHCKDGTHLGYGESCQHVVCYLSYKCIMSYCIPNRKVCDGIIDCPNADDEMFCTNLSCPGHLKCFSVDYCVPPWEICDGVSHCPFGEDENFCELCPSFCVCFGNTITCRDIDETSHLNNLISPTAVFLVDSHINFERLFHVHSMVHIYVQGGSLTNHAMRTNMMKSLRQLHLINIGLVLLDDNVIYGENIMLLNISDNHIASIQSSALSGLLELVILDLASNQLTSLDDSVFKTLHKLQFLFLEDNPLLHVSDDFLKSNQLLHTVRSDWYIVCCIIKDVPDCVPQSNIMSSCSDLVSSTLQRAIIVVQAICASSLNVIVLITSVYKLSMEHCFVISLSLADSLMGIYLGILSWVDLSSKNRFHEIIAEWTTSTKCLVAGLSNFISSEMSLFTLAIMSAVRAYSIQKVGGTRAVRKKVVVILISLWCVFVTVGLLHTFALAFSNLRLRNNMCIVYGMIFKRSISTFEYLFQVIVIIINTVSLVSMFMSSAVLFYLVKRSIHSIKGFSRDAKVTRSKKTVIRLGGRLLLLLMCNAICWVPTLVISLLLLGQTEVHEVTSQWMALLLIPFAAFADPVLYNLHYVRHFWKMLFICGEKLIKYRFN